MELGLIGNCQYNALIDPTGNISWLCWPRFDSSFVFGGLLDDDKGGHFRIGPEDGGKGQQVYIENSSILKTVFDTARGSFEIIDFAPRFRQYDRYYKPTMLIRIVRPISGNPLVKVSCNPKTDYGKRSTKPVFGSNHIEYEGAENRIRLTTNASLTLVSEEKPFVLHEPVYFCMTWGKPLESELFSTCDHFFEKTLQYWQRWVKHCHIPKEYQEEVIRSAIVVKLHQFEDTGAIIAATTTSLPEAQGTGRNWDYRFCWLRDALFSLNALQRLTQFEEMERFVTYLKNLVELKKDRLQPVYGVAGDSKLEEHILDHLKGYKGHQPIRIGNQAHEHLQHDVYGEMILAISQLFLDRRFGTARHQPVRLVKELLQQIEEFLEAGDAGLWEFRGTEQLHTFTVLMHWAGAKKAHEIGVALQDEELSAKAKDLQTRAAKIIDEQCWNEELGAYTQAAGGNQMDGALLMLINLGYIPADDPRAASQVRCIVEQLSAGNDLIHRYVHQDDFGETDNAFTICNFWLAEAYARIGETEKARKLLDKLVSASNHLGLYSEDLEPKTLEQWGNFPQTYSHVGLINAAIAISRPWDL